MNGLAMPIDTLLTFCLGQFEVSGAMVDSWLRTHMLEMTNGGQIYYDENGQRFFA